MKHLMLALTLAFSCTAFADENPFGISTGTTAAPLVTIPASTSCIGVDDEYGICPALMTSGGITISTLALALLKEDMQAVKGDAYNFMAGEPISAALAEVIEKMRVASSDLAQASDRVVIVTMLELI